MVVGLLDVWGPGGGREGVGGEGLGAWGLRVGGGGRGVAWIL